MDIDTKVIDGVMYITLKGELDEYSASFVRQYLDKAFVSQGFNDVVFDMNSLDFMDSTGIGVMLGRYKILKAKNKRAFISNTNNTIEKIFIMSGIYQIMPKIS